jgi:hypothetical protein
VNITAEPVELRHCYWAALAARFVQRGHKLGSPVDSISALACLDLDEHAAQREALCRREAFQGFLLGLKPQARAALLCAVFAARDREAILRAVHVQRWQRAQAAQRRGGTPGPLLAAISGARTPTPRLQNRGLKPGLALDPDAACEALGGPLFRRPQ